MNCGITVDDSCDISMIPALPEFQFLEIPGSMIVEKDFSIPERLRQKKLLIRNNDERYFFQSAADSGAGVRQDFYRMIRQKLSAAAALGAGRATLVPDLSTFFDAGTIPQKIRNVFNVYSGIAETCRIQLLLEIRIPGPAAASPQNYIRFKHDLLYPVRTLCEFHPHEPGALEAAEKFTAQCRFDSDIFRICFDAGSGNYLSGTLLSRLLKLIRKSGSEPPLITFAPGKNADTGVYKELANLINSGKIV